MTESRGGKGSRVEGDRWVSKDSQSLSLLEAPGEGIPPLRIHASAKSLGIGREVSDQGEQA